MFSSLIVLLHMLLLIEPAVGKVRKRVSIGTVKESLGAPDVLRNPSKILTESMKVSGKREGYVIALYKSKYWESTKIKPGGKIYYGDVLASGSKAKMSLTLDDGFKIVLDRNTKVRVSRRFIKGQKSSTVGRWMQLMNGTLRATVEKNKNIKTKFRTRSMSMGVRGTDFIVSNISNKSQVITIEGKVGVQDVSPKEAEIFEKITQAEEVNDTASVEKLVEKIEVLEIQEKKPEVIVSKGKYVETVEPPRPSVLKKMAPKQKIAALKRIPLGKPKVAAKAQIAKVKVMVKPPTVQGYGQARNTTAERNILSTFTQTVKELEAESGFGERFVVGLGFGQGNYTSSVHGKEQYFSTNIYPLLTFEYRFYPWLTVDLGLARAYWSDSWAEALGALSAKTELPVDMSYIGIGLWRSIESVRFGLRLAAVAESAFKILYEFDKNIAGYSTMEATYLLSPSVRLAGRVDWMFTEHWLTFFEASTDLAQRKLQFQQMKGYDDDRSADISSSFNFEESDARETVLVAGINWSFH